MIDVSVWDNIQCKVYIEKLISSLNVHKNYPITEIIDMKIYRLNQLLRLL